MEIRYPKNMQTRNGEHEVVCIIDGFHSRFGETALALLKRKEDGINLTAEYFQRDDGNYYYYQSVDNDGWDIVEVQPQPEKLYAWDIKSSAGVWFRIDQYLTEKEVNKRFPSKFGYVARVRGPEFVPPAESNTR